MSRHHREPAETLGDTTPGAFDTLPDVSPARAVLQARLSRRAESAANFVGVLVLAILGALALIHWMTPCEGAALCMAAVVTPTRCGPAGAVLRVLARLRLRLALADAELALDRVQADIELLPRVEDELRRSIDAMRCELATLQPARGVRP